MSCRGHRLDISKKLRRLGVDVPIPRCRIHGRNGKTAVADTTGGVKHDAKSQEDGEEKDCRKASGG